VVSVRAVRALTAGLAALVLVGGTAAWAASNRTVTVVVDGQARSLNTHARDVAGVLAHAGIELGAHDVVTPSTREPVAHGSRVVVDRGRYVTAVVDGRTVAFWTTARNVDSALADLGVRADRLRLSASRSTRLPLSGLRFEVRTEKTATLGVHGDRRTVTTYAATVGELLAEQGVTLHPGDEADPTRNTRLPDGGTVTVAHIERRTRTVTVVLPAPVQTRTDPGLMLDQVSVLTAGRPGRQVRTVEYTYADGRLRGERVLRSQTPLRPRTEVVVRGSTPYPADDTGRNWTGLAACESHNNPRAVSPNGTYHGLYQFSVDTWQRMGGTGVPSEATPREQTYRAILLYKRSGAGQWPHCGRYL
jgi:uncharacterized protein YabE (DUF348 family)